MPRIHAVATLAVTAGAVATASLFAMGDANPWGVVADLSVDAAPAEIAFAAPGVVQEAGIEIKVGSITLSLDDLVGPWSVNRSRREAIQSGSFAVPLSEWGVSPLGDPFLALGSPTGTREIEFWGCYRNDTTGAIYRYPLLLRGVVDNVRRESGPSGHIEIYQVLDAGARWSRIPVTMIFPPGHGLTTGRMTRKLLEAAGETQFALEDGRRRYKEAQFVDSDPNAAAQELNDVEARVVRWNRHGSAVNPTLHPDSWQGAVAIDEDDFLELSAIGVSFPGDVVTEVTATGTEQLHSDTDDDVCGYETREFPNAFYKKFKPWEAGKSQASNCALATIAASGESVHQLHTLTITIQAKRCGVLVREETATFQHYAPEAARYYWNGTAWGCLDGTIIATTGVEGIYLDAGAAASDGNIARAWARARWTMIGRTVTNHYYDAPGWTGPLVTDAQGGNETHFQGSTLGEETGAYLGSIGETFSFYNVRAATKDRDGETDPFDLLDPRSNVLRLGGGETVRDPCETFQRTARVVNIVRSNDDGYQESVSDLTYGYAIVPNGERYQYSDGSLSDEADEQDVLLGEVRTVYTPTGENAHTETVIVTKLGESPEVTTHNAEGAPPPIEYLPGYEPYDDQAFLDEEDLESAVQARAEETRPIKVTVSAPNLLVTHLPRFVKTSFPYAEDSDELYAACVSVIRESLVIAVEGTLGPNFLIADGTPLLVTHRPSGIGESRPMVVDEIGWGGAPDQPTTTRVRLEAYPDAA